MADTNPSTIINTDGSITLNTAEIDGITTGTPASGITLQNTLSTSDTDTTVTNVSPALNKDTIANTQTVSFTPSDVNVDYDEYDKIFDAGLTTTILDKLIDKYKDEIDKIKPDTTSDTTNIDASVLTNNVRVDDYNEYTVTGDGIFDVLMDTATKHLKAQFLANRFREEDYANAYVDIYKTTLQASLQLWSTALDNQQKQASIELTKAQAKVALIQAITELQKSLEIVSQMKQAEAQARQITAQTDLVKQQTLEQIYKNEYLNPVQREQILAQINTARKQQEVYNATMAKTVQETATEKAKELVYLRQREGFAEAHQKDILKTCLDTWSVAFSTATDAVGGADAIPTAITKTALNKLYDNIVYPDLDGKVDRTDSSTS